MDEFSLSFPGGKKIEIDYGNHKLLTDQKIEDGGNDEGMSPFDLFLASIIACSGSVTLGFLRKRNISTNDLKIRMYPDYDEAENRVNKVRIEIDVPDDFPEKYLGALEKVLDTCTVKKHLAKPPEFEVVVKK
ncbi:MAG: OsmC family protein [Firmicutes bacterium]|nr:OsmC family protein [Bacillota bacterium]